MQLEFSHTTMQLEQQQCSENKAAINVVIIVNTDNNAVIIVNTDHPAIVARNQQNQLEQQLKFLQASDPLFNVDTNKCYSDVRACNLRQQKHNLPPCVHCSDAFQARDVIMT